MIGSKNNGLHCLLRKLMDWFLYDNGLRHARAKTFSLFKVTLSYENSFGPILALFDPLSPLRSFVLSKKFTKNLFETHFCNRFSYNLLISSWHIYCTHPQPSLIQALALNVPCIFESCIEIKIKLKFLF